MVRIGPAPPGSTPFYRADDGLHFDGQNHRMMDFGHTFDAERGYRVFFKFRDSASANTWGPESLLDWADKLVPTDPDQVSLKRIAAQQARQCIALNREWQRAGRPAGGIPTDPRGRA